ncbi:hypothetical protein Tco_1304920 [Tanacetum coccineum]
MPYPRFTKVIIDNLISKDNSIFIRNRINLHIAYDDSLLGSLKFVSKTEDCQKYGALILDGMINDDIKLSTAYKTYLDYATGKVPPKKARKFKNPASPKLKTVPASPKEPIRWVGISKKIAPAKTDRGKGIELLSDGALLEDAQVKKTLRKSKRETHKVQASGSSEGANFESDKDENDDFNDEDDDGGNDYDSGSNEDGEQDEEYIIIPKKDESNDEEKKYEEEDDDVTMELYGYLNLTQGLRDTDMTKAEQGGGDQLNASYELEFVQEEDDGHVTLTAVHDKAEGTMQSSSITSNFTSKILDLDNTGPYVNEIASLMNTLTVPPPTPLTNPSSHLITDPQQKTPDSTTTTTNQTITLPEIPNFQFAKVVSSILGIVDQYLASKMKEAVDVAVRLQSNKLKEEAEAENQEFFNQVDSTMKAIIKEQVKAQVSKIMPQIEKYVTESLGAEVLVRSTNQPQTSYAVAASLSEFELKKILIDKMETNKSINRSDIQKNLYNALVEAYNSDKDIITSYGDVVTLKRGRDDQDKDEDPSAGSDRGTKRRKSSKDVEPSKGSKSKESKNESGHLYDQPDNEDSPKHDWVQTPNKPPTPDHAWNKSKSIYSRPPHKWINTIAKARQPPRMFDELMDTPIDFSAYVINHLKIDNLTQEILVGHAFNLLKGSCKSFAELEYHFEECYKVINDQLDWHNPEGREYPFDLNKPLSLIEDRGRQVVPTDYFVNNDLEYLKGGRSSSKYATSTTRTKATKYYNIEGIEDMVPTLWSLVKVAYNKHAIWGTYHWGPK